MRSVIQPNYVIVNDHCWRQCHWNDVIFITCSSSWLHDTRHRKIHNEHPDTMLNANHLAARYQALVSKMDKGRQKRPWIIWPYCRLGIRLLRFWHTSYVSLCICLLFCISTSPFRQSAYLDIYQYVPLSAHLLPFLILCPLHSQPSNIWFQAKTTHHS